MKNHPNVAVIVVAYNSFDVIPGMAETLPKDVPLFIVDNGPDDGMRAWADQKGIPVRVPPHNLGFGEGCNQGAAMAPDAEYLLFLNPDARLRPDTIPAFIAAMERYPQASALGPEICKPSGKPVSLRPSTLIPRTIGQSRKSFPDVDTKVPSLSGAALFVPASAFHNVGGFDPDIFMYFEDDDLTLRLSKEVGPLYYIPAAKVLHEGDASSPPSAELARFKGYHYARSQIYMRRKLGHKAPFFRGLASALRRCISIRLWRSEARRSHAIGRLAGAWSMRSGASDR